MNSRRIQLFLTVIFIKAIDIGGEVGENLIQGLRLNETCVSVRLFHVTSARIYRKRLKI